MRERWREISTLHGVRARESWVKVHVGLGIAAVHLSGRNGGGPNVRGPDGLVWVKGREGGESLSTKLHRINKRCPKPFHTQASQKHYISEDTEWRWELTIQITNLKPDTEKTYHQCPSYPQQSITNLKHLINRTESLYKSPRKPRIVSGN